MRVPAIGCLMLIGMLAGCATPEQEAQYNVRHMDYLITVYGPACDRLGFQRNTDQWRECIVRLDGNNQYYYGGGYSYYGRAPY
jgi:hypothetical protein